MDPSLEASYAFDMIVRYGYHHTAKLIYPAIKIQPTVNFHKIFSHMINFLTEATNSEGITNDLEQYYRTLLFLSEINIRLPTRGNTVLAGLFSRIDKTLYHTIGMHPTFLKIIELLVDMGGNLTDPFIVESCLVCYNIGGLMILDDLKALTPTTCEKTIVFIEARPFFFVDVLIIFSKYREFTSNEINILFNKLIRVANYEYSYSNLEYMAHQIRFFQFVAEKRLDLYIDDKILNILVESSPSVELIRSIFKNVVSIHSPSDPHKIKRRDLYDLFVEYNINVELVTTSDSDPYDSDIFE